MGKPFSENRRRDLRKRLIDVIEADDLERDSPLTDDASLIKSGQLDSLGLYRMALFIEREVGRKVDITSFDLATEWDSVESILDFIQKLRVGQQ